MSEKTDPMEKGTITLKINNVSTYMKSGQRIRTPLQQVSGIGWSVLAFPITINNVTYLWCFLEGVHESKWTAWVDATVRIVKNDGGFGSVASFHKKILGGEPLDSLADSGLFVTSEELLSAASGYVVDDSVEIRVDFSVTLVCSTSIDVFETAGVRAADVKLKVGIRVFYVNKGYLSVVASGFRDMFAPTEAAEDKTGMEEIELKDLDASEFKELLGVIYPTHYPITDANVVSLFRIAARFGDKRVMARCEGHLLGANSVPVFDKLKVAVDLNRDHLKNRLLSKMTCDDLMAINQSENLGQLGTHVLQALFEKHIGMHHP